MFKADPNATRHAGTHSITESGVTCSVTISFDTNFCQSDDKPEGYTGWVATWEVVGKDAYGDAKGVYRTSTAALAAFLDL